MAIDKKTIMDMVISEAEKQGVPVDLALALVNQESGFNPNVKSKVGAIGLMQLMPNTAKSLGVNPYDISDNIKGGITYLKNALIHYNNDVDKALASYNAGFGAVDKYKGIPPYKETQNYVKAIKAGRNKYLKIAENASQVPKDIANVPTSSDSLISKLGGQTTGAAANVNPIDTLGWGGLTPRTTYEQARKDAMDAAQAVQQYASDLTLTPETYQGSLEQKLIEAQYGATPEQLQSAYQLGNQNLQQAYNDVQAQNALTQQALEERYANMRNLVNSDPRLQNQGYYLDPNEIDRYQRSKAGIDLVNAQFHNQPLQAGMTPQEYAQQKYEAQIANQYGVPYQDFINSRLDNIQNLLGIDQIQLQNLITRANQGDTIAQQYLTAANQQVTNYQKNVGDIGKYNADLAKQLLTNQGNIREQGLQSYGNIMNTVTGAGYGIPTAISSDRAGIIRQGMSDETTQRGQNINALLGEGELGIKQAKLPSEIDAEKAEAQYRRSGALANLDYARVNPQMGSQAIYGYNLYPEDAKPTSGNRLLFNFMR